MVFIVQKGFFFVGGGSLIAGLDRLTEKVLKIRAHVADTPDECVVKGAAKRFEKYNTVSDGCFRVSKKKKNEQQNTDQEEQ